MLVKRAALRGWAQLPPYAVRWRRTTPVHLEMVPALIRAVPSVDVDVECWRKAAPNPRFKYPLLVCEVQVDGRTHYGRAPQVPARK